MGALRHVAVPLAGGALLAAAAPADAARVQLRPAGAVIISWHGDPALDCAAAGVCDARGTVSWRVGGRYTIGRNSSAESGEGGIPVVRATRGAAGTCVGVVAAGAGSLAAQSGRRAGVVELSLGDPFGGGVDSGRCAGPLGRDVQDALPRADVRLGGKLGRFTIDLRRETPFTAGALRGTVRSTVVIRARRVRSAARPRRPGIPPPALVPPRSIDRRIAYVVARYRVAALEGGAQATWRTRAGEGCAVLDACGVAGTTALAVAGRGGRLDVRARIRLRRGQGRPTRAQALAALRRRPSADGVFVRGTGTATATTTRDGAADCTDTTELAVTDLATRRRADGLRIALRQRFGIFGQDLLETRCLGPRLSDLAGSTALAGTLPRAALGAARLRVALRGGGAVTRGPFSGRVAGTGTLDLRRTRLDVRRSPR